jgi:hypothetical protein
VPVLARCIDPEAARPDCAGGAGSAGLVPGGGTPDDARPDAPPGVGGGRARAWWSAVPDQVGDGSTQQAESGGSACDGFMSCGSRYLGLRVP